MKTGGSLSSHRRRHCCIFSILIRKLSRIRFRGYSLSKREAKIVSRLLTRSDLREKRNRDQGAHSQMATNRPEERAFARHRALRSRGRDLGPPTICNFPLGMFRGLYGSIFYALPRLSPERASTTRRDKSWPQPRLLPRGGNRLLPFSASPASFQPAERRSNRQRSTAIHTEYTLHFTLVITCVPVCDALDGNYVAGRCVTS